MLPCFTRAKLKQTQKNKKIKVHSYIRNKKAKYESSGYKAKCCSISCYLPIRNPEDCLTEIDVLGF